MYQITNIIYIYLLIILSLIIFNIAYVLYSKENKYMNKKRFNTYKNKILNEISYMNKNNELSKKHIKYFIRKLYFVNNLIIYKDVINELKDSKDIESYLQKSIVIYQVLSKKYLKKNSIKKAYFSYFISELPIKTLKNNIHIVDALFKGVTDKSIYCRTNSMIAICKLNSKSLITKALISISKRNLYYNNKLLEENLSLYKGNKDSLIKELLYNFDKFTNNIKLAIINYIKYTSCNYTEELYDLFVSKKYDKEINLAIIRYFGKYEFHKILNPLLEIVNDYKEYDIEYTIVISQALSLYNLKNVKYTLIELLSNDNWYVRKNAANSLMKLSLTDKEYNEIENIQDKYGKEMFEYALNNNKIIKYKETKPNKKKERKDKVWINS